MELKDNERINEINEGLRIIESKNALTFGTDAYLLSAYLPKRSNARAVELGCGSGVVSFLALTKKKCRHVYGIEVQSSICDIAKRNAELNSLGSSFTAINKDLRDCSAADTAGEVDIVFSNPPYMKSSSGKANESEEKNLSRHEICGDINNFCKCAARLLKFGGDFYVVYRPDRMAELIYALKSNKLEPKNITFVHTNSHTPPSLLLVSSRLGGKGGMKISKPLFIYKDGTSEYTDEFKKIYENCNIDTGK
ncbi:MAG: tRNA1(Val) (adenine(37)-N6)-methyltransferase [Eubacteriales bacterium]